MTQITYTTRLQEILDTEGRSQAWLGRQVGRSRSAISQYCKGLHAPEDMRQAIAGALGRGVDDVFPRDSGDAA